MDIVNNGTIETNKLRFQLILLQSNLLLTRQRRCVEAMRWTVLMCADKWCKATVSVNLALDFDGYTYPAWLCCASAQLLVYLFIYDVNHLLVCLAAPEVYAISSYRVTPRCFEAHSDWPTAHDEQLKWGEPQFRHEIGKLSRVDFTLARSSKATQQESATGLRYASLFAIRCLAINMGLLFW